jgi:hypothetical protein
MGYYTEFHFTAVLHKADDGTAAILKRVIVDNDLGHDKEMFHSSDVFVPEIIHPFFKCERWYMLLISNDFGTTEGSKFEDIGDGRFRLSIHTSFKNYDSEVEKFLHWISPYVVGRKKKQFVGWSKGETQEDRNYHHILRP